MKRRALALGMIIIATLGVAIAIWLAQYQFQIVRENEELTKRLALKRERPAEIVAFSHEEQWTDYGPWLGRPRARMVYNITVRNDDVVALSGLELTVRTFSGEIAIGMTFFNRSSLLLPGEEHVITGESVVPIDEMTDLSFLATLKSGDVVVDELRLSVSATPFQQ